MKKSTTHKGFTLIELLIVNAIIAILVVIAIPNFRNAVIRSKLSRVKGDMKTLATALESYRVDNGSYPLYINPLDEYVVYEHFIPLSLTTPVAYLTSIPVDIFAENNPRNGDINSLLKQPFYYYTEELTPGKIAGILNNEGINAPDAKWIMWSYGPDLVDDGGNIIYDPTNGTLSTGDVVLFGP